MNKRVVTTCTRDCPNTCGLVATVENGRLTRLAGDPEHPLTRGAACAKTAAYLRRVYSPERVTHPLVRDGRGRWQRATWDEILDRIAERIKTIVAESGPEAILHYQGYGERTALKLLNRYFFNLLGGATTLSGSLCGGAGQGSQNLDFGRRISHDPLDHANSRSMILWARNPASTNVSLVPMVRDIQKRGGTVIAIDPARTRSARLADRHIAPRPGGDGWLAMAAAKLILAAGAEDRDFIEAHCEGFGEYRAILDRYSVGELCEQAGVAEADAALIAETLMREKPTSILLGWGLHRHEFAHQMLRPIDALGAISGNIGVPGGGVSQGFEEYGPYDPQYWGDDLNPPRRTLFIGRVGEEILAARDPEIRMIFVNAGNPLCMAPNSARVAEAFARTGFVVYSGHFLDDTAEAADVFLPATTFLEEHDVVASYGHNYAGPVNRAIEPVGEAKSEFRMFYDLAARFDFAERFRRDEDHWLQRICAPIREMGGSLDDLRQRAFRQNEPMVPYADGAFDTPSGKFRFMTEFDPAGHPAPAPQYPYRLLTIAPHHTICSERDMAGHAPLPELRLSAAEAARLDLVDGAMVRVSSPVGRASAILRVEDGLRDDVALAERGGWLKAGHGLNRLTRDLSSRVGGGTPFYETTVRVEPHPDGGPAGPRILVVRHAAEAPGGNFTKALERLGARLTTIDPTLRPPADDAPNPTREQTDAPATEQKNGAAPEDSSPKVSDATTEDRPGTTLPDSPGDFAGLVVLGGPQHAFDDEANPHFPALMQLMRDFDAAGRPVAGLCLGAQLMARAFGAQAVNMARLEMGYVQHALTPDGAEDPVLGPAGELPPLMEFHEDTFGLPEDAKLLVRGEDCPNQCFRAGNAAYGFQFHLEVDAAVAADWLGQFRRGHWEGYKRYRPQYDDAFIDETLAMLPVRAAESDAFCRGVAERWLALTDES